MPAIDPGPIVLPSDVEAAVRETLNAWVPHYLAHIDEQAGLDRGTTEAPRLWDIASENATRWREETAPVAIVACPGTVEDPELHGEAGSYAAWWQVNIGVTAAGATEEGSRGLAGRLAGAVILALAQQGDMGGLAETTRWLGVRTDDMPRRRGVAAAEVLAHVRVRRVVDTRGLIPRDLPADPTDPPAATPTPTRSRVIPLPRR
jgi:hypothetical protein